MAKNLKRSGALKALGKALISGSRGGPTIGQRASAFPRMLRATFRRQYDGAGRIALMVLGVVYIISPVDFIPEIIFGPFGLVDDAGVAVWLAGTILAETQRFLEWEKDPDRTVVV